jgi:hypothetical protein
MRVENPARNKLKRVLFVADNNRMPGVMTTLITGDNLVALGEQVDYFCLAFVAPLGSDDD